MIVFYKSIFFCVNQFLHSFLCAMDAEAQLQGDVSDGAEMSPLVENPPETIGEIADDNITTEHSDGVEATEDAGNLYF